MRARTLKRAVARCLFEAIGAPAWRLPCSRGTVPAFAAPRPGAEPPGTLRRRDGPPFACALPAS